MRVLQAHEDGCHWPGDSGRLPVRDVRQMSQCERILDRLERGPITPMEAWNELGIYRLASRVKDLRDKGHVISGSRVNVANRFGETCSVARYSLEK